MTSANTNTITATTLRRLRKVIDQPTPAGFTRDLLDLYLWAEQPGRIVQVTATLTALISDTAQMLGDLPLWIQDARCGAAACATTEAVLDLLVASECDGGYDGFVPLLVDWMLADGITLEELLVELLHLAVVMSVLDEL